eukprot:15452017-Alexandrium_andersonii.AAC.1
MGSKSALGPGGHRSPRSGNKLLRSRLGVRIYWGHCQLQRGRAGPRNLPTRAGSYQKDECVSTNCWLLAPQPRAT